MDEIGTCIRCSGALRVAPTNREETEGAERTYLILPIDPTMRPIRVMDYSAFRYVVDEELTCATCGRRFTSVSVK